MCGVMKGVNYLGNVVERERNGDANKMIGNYPACCLCFKFSLNFFLFLCFWRDKF